MFGIDISAWQGDYDLAAAKRAGVQAVVLRCGGADDGLYEDSQFKNNVRKCEQLGLPYGVYYFGAWPVHIADQISHCLRIIKGTNPTLGVYYDIEAGLLARSANEVSNMANAWITRIGKQYRAGVYASSSTYDSHLGDLKPCLRWVAQWSTDKPSGKVDIWQFGGESNYLRSNEINGQVIDQDYFYIKPEKKKEKKPMKYNKESEVPAWARPTITELIDRGYLSGSGKRDKNGRPVDLDLSPEMLRTLIVCARMNGIGGK